MILKLLARVIIYDEENDKILLVKNRGANFWYTPGGGWEHDRETVIECAKREVYEETGLTVEILRMLWTQEFHESSDKVFFETFWLARAAHNRSIKENHTDHDPTGNVEKAQWFGKEELVHLKVFPKRLKGSFWDDLIFLSIFEDPFIGVS